MAFKKNCINVFGKLIGTNQIDYCWFTLFSSNDKELLILEYLFQEILHLTEICK